VGRERREERGRGRERLTKGKMRWGCGTPQLLGLGKEEVVAAVLVC